MGSWDEREDDFEYKPTRTAAKGTVHVGIWIVVVLVVMGVIGGGVWLVKVATSDIKGVGDAEIIKNDAKNRIRAQEGFLDKYNAVVTADKNLTLTGEALARTPDSVKLQTELTGQKMACNDLVGRYNADANKFSKQEFMDAELPKQIDESDITTDCKEK